MARLFMSKPDRELLGATELPGGRHLPGPDVGVVTATADTCRARSDGFGGLRGESGEGPVRLHGNRIVAIRVPLRWKISKMVMSSRVGVPALAG